VAKGDRVKVKGYFRERSYEKDGETKTVRDFVVKDLKVERRKVRKEAE
jgi:single-stranded DNA-binding protein